MNRDRNMMSHGGIVKDSPFRMRHLLTILFVATVLAACVTDPAAEQAYSLREMERIKISFGAACENLGYTADTDPWRDCLLKLEQQRTLQQYMWNRPYYPYGPFNPYYPPWH